MWSADYWRRNQGLMDYWCKYVKLMRHKLQCRRPEPTKWWYQGQMVTLGVLREWAPNMWTKYEIIGDIDHFGEIFECAPWIIGGEIKMLSILDAHILTRCVKLIRSASRADRAVQPTNDRPTRTAAVREVQWGNSSMYVHGGTWIALNPTTIAIWHGNSDGSLW